MADRLVICGSTAGSRRSGEALRLDLTGPDRNVELRLQDISKRMVTHVPDLLTDLLEIAAYVYSADWGTSRGGPVSSGMGKAWRRRFRFVIPVRKPELWSSPPVIEALCETLGFLTEDEYRFEFEQHEAPPPAQEYFEFGDQGEARSDEVVLFSGGLDSLAGAVDLALGRAKTVALVSHHSSTKIAARQKQLVSALRNAAPGRLLHFPVLLQKGEGLSTEYTLRSRSFVFASLGLVISRMLGNRRILMCENGIVSLNLPIAHQLVGARSSRTTHPKVLASYGHLFEILCGEPTLVENPLLWKTKTEVVKIIRDHGCSYLIAGTISCSHVYEMRSKKPHCGECSQCIERRFATLSDDLQGHDPQQSYRHDLLLDEWKENEPRALAENYVRFVVDMKNASPEALYARFAGELSRAIQWLPGERDANARALVDIHKRHAMEVFSILEREVIRHARGLLDGSLPPFCLLRMAVSRDHRLEYAASASIADETAATEVGGSRHPEGGSRVPEIWMAVDEADQVVLVDGGLRLDGASTFKLLKFLIARFEADQRSQKPPDGYRFATARTIAIALGVREPTVRKRIERIRRLLFEWHADDYPLTKDAMIENNPWDGYRINPSVRLLKLSDVSWAGESSQPSCQHVTSRSA